MERMNGADAFMLYLDETSAYNHTIKLFVLDPSHDPAGWSFERFRKAFASRLNLVPRLRHRYLTVPLGLHHPVWVDDPEFDLDYHLQPMQCPAPGTMIEASRIIAETYARPLDHARPLWKLILIEGLENGRVAVLMLVHHAFSDGVGVLRMMMNFWTTRPEAFLDPAAEQWSPRPLPGRSRLLLDGLRGLPVMLVREVPQAVRGLLAIARVRRRWQAEGRELPPAPGDKRYIAPFAQHISTERSFAARSFPMARLKGPARRFGATLNDVFLACVSGAIRRLLMDRDQPAPAAPMIATVPFSLVPLEQRTRDGNYSTTNFTLLHVDVADPVERLAACKRSADTMKAHFEQTRDANIAALLNILPPLVPKLLARANEKRGGGLLPFWNVVVSNVPGPRQHLHLGELDLADYFSSGQVTHGAGLNLTVWSYVDRLSLCVLADSALVPDPWALMAHFEASVAELERAAAAAEATESARPHPVTA